MRERETFELPTDDGLVVRGEALLPAGHTATVVLCHGFKGFARWGFLPWLAGELVRAGVGVVRFDFSGSGVGPDGETFTELAAFERNTYGKELRDLALVEAEGMRRGWLGVRYGLFGHSRGGGVAVLHAARSDHVAALVTWAAIAEVGRWPAQDVEQWRARGYTEVRNVRTSQVFRLALDVLEEVDRLKATTLDVLGAAGRIGAPWLIVHGTRDETVPYTDAERLHAASLPGTARLLLLDGVGHTFDIRHPMEASSLALEQAGSATVDFFRAHLA